MAQDLDVIIVGGRIAGGALASRLEARGLRVLCLDRMRFPSAPGVPSSPILYPAAIEELLDLGLPAEAVDRPDARMESLTFQFHPWWHVQIPVPPLRGGRRYVVGVDRRDLDQRCGELAGRAPGCERREGWAARELLRDGAGRVCGVLAVGPGERAEQLRAGCVVGADGRFSFVGRQAGAALIDERMEHTSTVYFADWEGIGPDVTGSLAAQVVTAGKGLEIIFFRMPGGRHSINIHLRSDRAAPGGDPQGYYLSTLRSLPPVAQRLEGARQVSRVLGIKRVANGYRQAWGPGWVLVGDALHFKDPVDGQGIRDALVGARLLAEALVAWQGGRPWEEAMEDYARAFRAETWPMYLASMERLQRELYQEPPALLARSLLRWWLTDPLYQQRFLEYLDRDRDPSTWLSPGLAVGAALRGLGRDIAGRGSGA